MIQKQSRPITFLATHVPADPQYDEDFFIERTTVDAPEPYVRGLLGHEYNLTDTEWFDQELQNFGYEGFLTACGLIDDVRQHGTVKATVIMQVIHINNSNGEDWDMDFEVVAAEPAKE